MHHLKIKTKDWLFIFLFGVFFGTLFGTALYILASSSPFDGAILGGLNGFFIALMSLLFITIGNNFILPKVAPKYWNGISFVLAFLSGVFGSLWASFAAIMGGVFIIDGYYNNLNLFTFLIGLITYLIGFVMYLFVSSRNQQEFTAKQYKESRLHLLQAQLNPHFLFNSLNSVAELVYVDAKKSERAIMNISKFLRSTLDESLKVSLENELELVQNYVNIENIRFMENITLQINRNNEATKEIFLPKFSIQLLIENAIKHNNVAKKTLTVKVEIEKIDTQIIITVTDNGKGFETIHYGTGLTNLKERLEFLNNGTLTQTSDTNKTQFKITLKDNYENIGY
ncbi:MAG: histidine kinase [Arcobacteraceae bacterium]|nr:histidine kinase [Arcobacteraceae bacterium]